MKILIKKLKIENYLWGCTRIQDELEKISIDISRETIKILGASTEISMFGKDTAKP